MIAYHVRVVLTALAICAPISAMASSPVSLWDPETALTVPPVPSLVTWPALMRKLVVTDNGQRHLVYHKYIFPPNETTQVYYKRFVPGSGWLPETCISRCPGSYYYNRSPAIGLDSPGNLHVVWTDAGGYFVYYRRCDSAGVWDSVATMLSNESGTYDRWYPGVACTPDGHVHAVWHERHPMEGKWLVYREKVADTWGPACIVDSVGVDTTQWPELSRPCIAADRDNSVHLTYLGGRLPGEPPGQNQIYYRRRGGGVWGPRERVSLGSDDARQLLASITVNPLTGEPHVVWQGLRPDTGTTCIWHSQRTGNGWLPPQLISDSSHRGDQVSASIVFTRDGIGHVAWCDYGESEDLTNIVYAERNPSGWWQPPVALTSDSAARRVYCGLADGGPGPDSNHIHLVWTDERDGPEEVYYRHGAPSPSGIKWDEEEPLGAARAQTLGATVCRGVLSLPPSPFALRTSLFSPAGRKVAELRPGRNDVRHLAPGAYFVRSAPGAVLKVVVME